MKPPGSRVEFTSRLKRDVDETTLPAVDCASETRNRIEMEELTATFRRIKWTADGDGTRFIIATADTEQDGKQVEVSIKGDADPKDFIQGIDYRFFGKWGKPKPPYGKPFEFKQFMQGRPHSRVAVVGYLTRFAVGVGPVYASQLWDAFGPDAVRILRSEPAKAAKALGLPTSRLAEASRSLGEFIQTEETRLDGRGFPKTLIETVIKKWGIHAPARIRRDPFTLLVSRLPGCGFARCDRLYTDLGLPLDRLKRQFACIWKSLREDGSGNTWHPLAIAKQAVEAGISGVSEEGVKWQRAVMLGVRSRWLAYRKDEQGQGWIGEKKQTENEATVARCIRELMNASCGMQWPIPFEIEGLTEHQYETLVNVFRGPVCILTGDPGTGKTTAAALVIKRILADHPRIQIAVASPTNMAAMRIRKELDSHNISSSVTATTFHRLLGVTRSGHDGGGWGFVHHENNKLQIDVLFVDEDSMRDIDISAALLQAIKPGTLICFLGDTNQLPPVGHGAPLRDFIAAGIPRGHLTEVLRNNGSINTFCKACREAAPIIPPKRIDIAAGLNHLHYECSAPGMAKMILAERLRTLMGGIEIDGEKIDPIRGLQIIVALNEKGELSREAVNTLAQSVLNPDGMRAEFNPFRVRDKIICGENCKLKCCDESGETIEVGDEIEMPGDDQEVEEFFVANGELGIVVAVTKKFSVVRMEASNQLVRVPVAKGENSANGEFCLAYAVTFHKSQGNAWPIVFLLTDRAANRMGSRELWNTGGSRPRSLLVTIGELSTIQRQCRRNSLSERKTFLREMMLNG
jgi:exodeoxyribonuclease V alpha subunit